MTVPNDTGSGPPMVDFLLWLTSHKATIALLTGFILWAAGGYIYLRYDLRNFRARGRPHSWRVDLNTKQGFRNNKLESGPGSGPGH